MTRTQKLVTTAALIPLLLAGVLGVVGLALMVPAGLPLWGVGLAAFGWMSADVIGEVWKR